MESDNSFDLIPKRIPGILNNIPNTTDEPEFLWNFKYPASITQDEHGTFLNDPGSITEDESDNSSNLDGPPITGGAQNNLLNFNCPPLCGDDQSMDNRLLKAAISGKTSEMKHMILQDPKVLLGTTQQGSTCLHISSIFGHKEFSMAMLALNQSLLSSINSYGETPLIVALTSGHVSLASAMLKRYQQLKLSEMILKQDKNRDNALHHAIRNGHRHLALELIATEPDLTIGVNKYNESAMYIAVSRGFSEILERLLKIPDSSHVGPIDENALHAAC